MVMLCEPPQICAERKFIDSNGVRGGPWFSTLALMIEEFRKVPIPGVFVPPPPPRPGATRQPPRVGLRLTVPMTKETHARMVQQAKDRIAVGEHRARAMTNAINRRAGAGVGSKAPASLQTGSTEAPLSSADAAEATRAKLRRGTVAYDADGNLVCDEGASGINDAGSDQGDADDMASSGPAEASPPLTPGTGAGVDPFAAATSDENGDEDSKSWPSSERISRFVDTAGLGVS